MSVPEPCKRRGLRNSHQQWEICTHTHKHWGRVFLENMGTCTHTHARAHAHAHTRAHAHTYTDTHAHTNMRARTHTHADTHVHARVHTHARTHTDTCTHARTCTHTHTHTGAARSPSTSEAPVVLVEPQPLPCSLHGPVRRHFCSTLDPAPCLLEERAFQAQPHLWGLASPAAGLSSCRTGLLCQPRASHLGACPADPLTRTHPASASHSQPA